MFTVTDFHLWDLFYVYQISVYLSILLYPMHTGNFKGHNLCFTQLTFNVLQSFIYFSILQIRKSEVNFVSWETLFYTFFICIYIMVHKLQLTFHINNITSPRNVWILHTKKRVLFSEVFKLKLTGAVLKILQVYTSGYKNVSILWKRIPCRTFYLISVFYIVVDVHASMYHTVILWTFY